MTIRRAYKDDAIQLWNLRTKAITNISDYFYNKNDTRKWAEQPMFEAFKEVIINNFYLVNEDENAKIIAGGFLDLQNKSIEAMYVDPDHQGLGLGKMILTQLLEEAKRQDFKEVSLSATLNAEPFYLSVGFIRLKKSLYNFKDGRTLDCIDMKIFL